MKLKEFIEIVELGKTENDSFNELYGKQLKKYKDIILKTDEFKDCESLDILEHPVSKSKDGNVLTPYTIKLSDIMKFKGRCYLLSLTLTPEMYDPTLMLEPVKDGAAIGPTVYDPITFEPKRQILLTYNPSVHFNIKNPFEPTEEMKRGEIHQLLDKVLDNFDEYKIKGVKGVLVRGLFEIVENGEDVPKPFDNNRLRDILAKNKDVEDRISKIEEHDNKVKQMIKESKHDK